MRIAPHLTFLLMALFAGCAHQSSVAHRPAQATSYDLSWIIGTWESVRLDYGEFRERRGAVKLEVIAFAPDDIDLVLTYPSGERRRAYDSWPNLMDEETLFFGPIGSGLPFRYRRDGPALHLHLDTSGARVEAVLRRVGPPPPETERLPGPRDLFRIEPHRVPCS